MQGEEKAWQAGTADESSHGWAPDVEGSGPAKDAAIEANKKAFEARDTQQGSRADGDWGADPDFPPGGVGESAGRRGEDVVKREGTDPGHEDQGTKGASQRPVGSSDAEASTGVDPQDERDEEMPNTQTA